MQRPRQYLHDGGTNRSQQLTSNDHHFLPLASRRHRHISRCCTGAAELGNAQEAMAQRLRAALARRGAPPTSGQVPSEASTQPGATPLPGMTVTTLLLLQHSLHQDAFLADLSVYGVHLQICNTEMYFRYCHVVVVPFEGRGYHSSLTKVTSLSRREALDRREGGGGRYSLLTSLL
jgi:hypothetical protein